MKKHLELLAEQGENAIILKEEQSSFL